MMAIMVSFHPVGLTNAKYDESVRRLVDAGAWLSPGHMSHTCFGEDGDLRIVEVFESQEHFDAFGKTLMPILDAIGIDAGQPEISQVHNCRSVECL